ncbi:IS3 family transposase [Mycoplasma sp. CSL7491-lung]|uniref:IS3 family transposase n=1 Tax=Mycoplasma sp. CSL7491-lung TaxID=549718 RepID=UPI001C126E32|nr:IS3 family transposase [Mycoplasma sp. CSL7491-lung]MBU4693240.1 IS3 family transposase [Mycoplasma sp. CSL7491-lung]
MDLYNSEIVSFSLSTSPNVKFTNKSLLKRVKKLPNIHNLIIHTDQGFQYQNHSWINILKENKITQSMSRKGNCLDNSPMENFFSMLKREMFYGIKYNTIEELALGITKYIKWYNNERIKEKLKGMSPVQYS